MADGAVQAALTADIGGERFELEHVECVETLGRPFTLMVDVLSKLGEVDFLPHLGKPVSLAIRENADLSRHFHGVLVESEFRGESPLGSQYRLVARPFTHFMDQNRGFRIFQDMSALDIVRRVLEAAGAVDVDYGSLSRQYVPRTYCVQYGESDFRFISRLLEEEGIYYYYKHEAERHVLTLCDGPGSHIAGDPATANFNIAGASARVLGVAKRATVQRLSERLVAQSAAQATLRDFDFTRPGQPVQGDWSEAGDHPGDTSEYYVYPGRFTDERHGGSLSKAKLAALRGQRQSYSGRSQSVALACGRVLTLDGHPVERLDQDYLLTRTHHSVAVRDQPGRRVRHEYVVAFDAIRSDALFHVAQETPRPRVHGLESAIVTGPEGETIFTDEYGRVKVRFHWDRSGSAGEVSTCWIRVAQFSNLGSVVLPRVGQEVMVDFLYGNPDHPIVAGWTFNGDLRPIYPLPEHKTRALWRTLRYGPAGQYPDTEELDTGAPGVNELRFEDRGGREEVFLHAERDLNTRARFDETHHIGHNQEVRVGLDRTRNVGRDETVNIGRHETLTVGGDQTEEIKGKRDVTVTGSDTLTVKSEQVIDVTQSIKITAGTSITLKCGASTVQILPGSVKITSPVITTEATGINTVKGNVVHVKGAGMIKEEGGVILLN